MAFRKGPLYASFKSVVSFVCLMKFKSLSSESQFSLLSGEFECEFLPRLKRDER